MVPVESIRWQYDSRWKRVACPIKKDKKNSPSIMTGYTKRWESLTDLIGEMAEFVTHFVPFGP